MTALITIDCHHEAGFEAVTYEVIFLCLKRGRLLRKMRLRRWARNDNFRGGSQWLLKT